ncbi:glycine betaine ABC transporter substrate-binding protein [Paenibacillus sp. GCM10028914]|uniref:glycine betaine ABC transporter substrate-binding protein n=1 Tax=Paenibacillus sp. GCM10028914 TaxID=3273416 RepID=UPI0036075AD3
MKKTKLLSVLSLAAVLVLSACGNSGDKTNGEAGTKTIGQQVNYEIIGIDPGAGIMKASAKAIEDYGLTDWKLIEGSGAAMTATLAKAMKNEEPIIITGWTPHWMFAKYDLKYLEDPKKTFGEAEEIHTLARKGLEADHPEAYQFLKNFKWTADEMGEIMTAIQEGTSPTEAAKAWAESHPDRIDEWTKDITPVSNKELKLSYVAWDSEIASTHLVQYILENKLGYKVTALQVEAGPMWTGVANGDVDASVSAWLPLTHADYWEKFKDKVEDLGANMEGVKTGLVVPSYMDINSIEDLKTK